jgi:hypothetical protein
MLDAAQAGVAVRSKAAARIGNRVIFNGASFDAGEPVTATIVLYM